LQFVLAIGLAGAAVAQEPEVPPDALIRLRSPRYFTVMATVVECLMLPDVPVMVTVYVPAGVPL
jgi:hypothetical protein